MMVIAEEGIHKHRNIMLRIRLRHLRAISLVFNSDRSGEAKRHENKNARRFLNLPGILYSAPECLKKDGGRDRD